MANIRVTELDFDQIKENLRDFLRTQTAFTDYDFEGSNLSVLMDLLAYNTHYNAVLANMVSNEMFLDSAIKRSSVASLAKHLRYTPRSVRSARAKISITLQNVPGNPIFVNLNPFTLFSTIIDGQTTQFYNRDAYTTIPEAGVYTFEEIELYQGRKLDYYFTVQAGATAATKYVLPNLNVDTQTLRVQVTHISDNTINTYTLMNDITEVNSTSKVYYLEENTSGYYQLHFGDGVLGRALQAGDVISLEYLISDGAAGNISNNITPTWSFNSIAGETDQNRSATTISKPQGGAAAEDIESIRFNSIRRYTTQGRAVTNTDYAALITSELPSAQSVNVWGGENNIPPKYGTVFISIKPRDGFVLTDIDKDTIINNVIKPRALVTTTHEFVDPVYTYISPYIVATYDPSRTNKTAAALTTQINTLLEQFFETNLQQFNAAFYSSQLNEQLMDIDDAIVSINLITTLQKRLSIAAGRQFSGTLYWPGRLEPGGIVSNFWVWVNPETAEVYTLRLRDFPDTMPPNIDGTGTLRAVNAISGEIVINNVGSINYATGAMNIVALPVTGYIGIASDVRIRAAIQDNSQDIVPGYNEILTQDNTVADVVSNQINGITIGVKTLRT
jgi:hypothetical protein